MKYIKVKVKAGQRKEEIIEKKENTFEISVREKAERNMANERVIELIANHFDIPKNKVRIVNGHHHPSKMLVIEMVAGV